MNAVLDNWFQSSLLIIGTFALVAGSLWLATRLAPWFLQRDYDAPPLTSWFTDFESDLVLDRARIVVGLLAFALTLFAMLSVAIVVRLLGVSAF
jgi:hypothetical protein